ncbi:hypothetical protein PIIN_05268 [Serendipita indica DSM 11827]|uniref:F-box domain-containing protein n=1 Tax=Serendipita indica (strain DSM 11827) TaxID=1109443 RepID=G4TJ36_SERID|nr:hypothetical protein PIIN_05268 [Serendipita indica DSM 11827]
MDYTRLVPKTSQERLARIRQIHQTYTPERLRATFKAFGVKREQLQKQLVALDALSDIIKQSLMESTSPAKRLPLEIISMILVYHICGNYGSLQAAMLVCRRWHRAAKLAGEIWSTIEVQMGYHYLSSDGVARCGTEKQLLRAFTRSEGLPLSISFDAIFGSYESHVTALFNSVREHFPSPRARSLRVTNIHQLASALFDSWDLTGLEEIETEDDRLLKRAILESRKLAILRIRGSQLKPFQSLPLWGRLRKLHISKVDGTVLGRILILCERVNDLTLQDCELNPQANPILMPQLWYLVLRSCTPFWPIDCPNIMKLSLEYTGRSDSIIHTDIVLPRLRIFDYTGSSADIHLPVFKVPNLEDLKISGPWNSVCFEDNDNLLSRLWVNRPREERFNPCVLHLRNMRVDQKLLAKALATLTRCVKLRLHGIVHSVELFKVLKVEQKRIHSGIAISRTLESLVITFSGLRRVSRSALTHRAREFAEARKSAGIPLRYLEIGYDILEDCTSNQ